MWLVQSFWFDCRLPKQFLCHRTNILLALWPLYLTHLISSLLHQQVHCLLFLYGQQSPAQVSLFLGFCFSRRSLMKKVRIQGVVLLTVWEGSSKFWQNLFTHRIHIIERSSEGLRSSNLLLVYFCTLLQIWCK